MMINKNKKLCGIFFLIFFIAGCLTSLWGLYSANTIFKSSLDLRYAYYWMDSKFAFIQFANNMLFLGGFISCCFGALLKNDQKNAGEALIIYNIMNMLACAFSTWICLLIVNKYKSPSIDFNIFIKSAQSMIGFYLFINFWSFVAYGLKLTTQRKVLTISILFAMQLMELFIIPKYRLFNLLQYLPTTLSRELVIKQFPFWIKGTWVNNLGVFSYGNVTPVLNDSLEPKNINLIFIYSLLIIYLSIVFVVPIVKQKGWRKRCSNLNH